MEVRCKVLGLLVPLFLAILGAMAAGEDIEIISEVGLHTDAYKSEIPYFYDKTGIGVGVEEVPYEQYRELLMLRFTTGTAYFDMAYIPIGWVPPLVEGGYIAPWPEDALSSEELADFPGIENCYFNGELYFIPYMNESHGVLYRTDLFSDPQEQQAFRAKYGYDLAPPRTVKQYRDVAEFFYRPPELYGVTLMGLRGALLSFHFCNRLFNYGGDILDDEYHPAFANEAGVKALQELREMFQFAPPGAASYGWQEAMSEFFQGRSAMAEMATTVAMGAQNPEVSKVVGKVGFVGVPVPEDVLGTPVKRFYLPFGFVLNAASTNVDEVVQWVRFITGFESMKRAAPVGNIPARVSVLLALEEQYPFLKGQAEIMKTCKLEPMPLIPEGATIVEDYIALAVSQFLAGEKSAEDALAEAANRTESLLRDHGYYK